jgi:soluble lytic murein transglycosylase
MQLLPSTARDMSSSEENSLSTPDVNLAVGQKYVRHLLKDPAVGGDLFKMAMAYNAGPGNLARWQRNASEHAKDPLLFLESIPAAETRAFVERVMVNYWIYSIRMGKDIPSLEAVASRDETVVASSGLAHAGLIEIASSR